MQSSTLLLDRRASCLIIWLPMGPISQLLTRKARSRRFTPSLRVVPRVAGTFRHGASSPPMSNMDSLAHGLYTIRWVKNAYAGNATNTMPILRTLNVRNTIPVDLNSILCMYRKTYVFTPLLNDPLDDYRILLADLYDKHNSKSSKSLAKKHRAEAATLRSAILDLFWDSKRLAFYDFNMTSHARGTLFSAAHYYPFWNDIIPDEVAKDKTGKKAFGAVGSALNFIMRRYNGTVPATLIESGLQWDAPVRLIFYLSIYRYSYMTQNTWPPHQYIAMQALLHLPKSLKLSSLSSYGSDTANSSSYSLIPPNQLGLPLGDIPAQPVTGGGSSTGDINTLPGSTVVNGGNATKGETWAATLSRELANRYISSAFCSWYATGGSIPGILNQLSEAELNVTGSVGGSGHMFEKVSCTHLLFSLVSGC